MDWKFIINNQSSLSLPRKWPQKNSCHPVSDSEPGDDEEEHPPEPQDEEIFLVEEIVLEDAQIVGLVHPASGGPHSDVAADFSGEELAHWVVKVFSSPPIVPVHTEILQDPGSVVPELVVEDPVSHLRHLIST